jgi:hypothetical protein
MVPNQHRDIETPACLPMHLEKLFYIARCKIIWLIRKKFISLIPLPYRRMNHINQPPLETHTHKRAHRGRAHHVGLGHDGAHQGCDGDRPRGHCRGDCKPPHYPTRRPLSAEFGVFATPRASDPVLRPDGEARMLSLLATHQAIGRHWELTGEQFPMRYDSAMTPAELFPRCSSGAWGVSPERASDRWSAARSWA